MTTNTSTITIEATAQREAMPDVARITALARAGGEDAGAARAIVRDRTATIRESVSDVDSVAIHTLDIEIDESAELFEPETDAPYVARERLEIRCAPEAAEAVVIAVTDAGGSVQSVEFALHEQVRRELEDEAQGAALKRARKKATTLAGAEGLSVGEAQTITTTDVDTGMSGLVEMAVSEPDCDVAPAPITVSEAVEVVYELVED